MAIHPRLPQALLYSLLIAVLMVCISGNASVKANPSEADLLSSGCTDPSDDCWLSDFRLPGVVGNIKAMARDSHGNLYVGGEIIQAGGLAVNYLAMWNGSAWSNVGGGVTRTNGSAAKVYALAVDDSDNLYVGGYFEKAGAASAVNLAKWDGSAWSAVGGGTDGSVYAIEAVSSGIYIGGSFDLVGSTAAAKIAYRDFSTSTWAALGSGVSYEDIATVYALEYEPGSSSLFVGGDFSSAGGVSAYHIARYTGGVWYALDSGFTNGGDVSTLLAVPRAGGYDLYVGGYFGQVGTAPAAAHNIAHWDGSSWSALSYGTGGEVFALAYDSDGNLIVAGSFTSVGSGGAVAAVNIASWNGATWTALGDGLGTETYTEINELLLSGSDLLAGGSFTLTGDLVVNGLAQWNGSVWSALGGGLGVNNSVDLLMADGNSVYATGSITHYGSLQADGLAQLNADLTWSVAGPAASFIRALAKSTAGTLYAGGAFSSIGGASARYLAYWNGAAWQELAGGADGYVNALALASDGKLYAGGAFTSVGSSVPASHIAMWDGSQWHTLGNGIDGNVRSLALDSAGNLYAGGEFYYAGGVYTNHIAMWDGSQWHALGSGLTSQYIESLVFDGDGRLYAGGYFAQAGGILANSVAMWNGYAWSALGSGMDDGVGALAIDTDGYLYAGGDFDTAGGVTVNHIARWDGFTWSAMGSGADSNVFALAVPGSGSRLIVGGVFKNLGGKPAAYIGAYEFPEAIAAPAPALTGLQPAAAMMGGASFWLVVNGTNFSSRSIVRWNGNPLPTTYVNGGQLKALVPAAAIAESGSAALSVFTPAPSGGGASLAQSFTISEGYQYHIHIPVVIRN
jgi:hypothetical protein